MSCDVIRPRYEVADACLGFSGFYAHDALDCISERCAGVKM